MDIFQDSYIFIMQTFQGLETMMDTELISWKHYTLERYTVYLTLTFMLHCSEKLEHWDGYCVYNMKIIKVI